MPTMTADLARDLYWQDAAHTSPWLVDGHTAYDGWLRAASEAGDMDLVAVLRDTDRNEFAAAWTALALEA